MKEYILAEDEYTTIILRTDDDETYEPDELVSIINEYELHRMEENRKNKRHEIIYI